MSLLAKIRHTFHYSNCYLYWCMFQLLTCLTLICLFFVNVFNNSNQEYLFFIESTIFMFMLLDVILFFILFGCRFQPIVALEVGLVVFSGIILLSMLIEDFKKIVEEYDFVIMMLRIFIQVIRMGVLGFKTSDSKKKQEVSQMSLELNSQTLDESVHESNFSSNSKQNTSIDGNVIYYGDKRV